jgi:3-(3-hydroxy-phenyl)propionate hydroxylase
MVVMPSRSTGSGKKPGSDSLEAEDVHGKFRDWKMQNPGWQFIILRPDRYVAAACSAAELPSTAARFMELLGMRDDAERLAA